MTVFSMNIIINADLKHKKNLLPKFPLYLLIFSKFLIVALPPIFAELPIDTQAFFTSVQHRLFGFILLASLIAMLIFLEFLPKK